MAAESTKDSVKKSNPSSGSTEKAESSDVLDLIGEKPRRRRRKPADEVQQAPAPGAAAADKPLQKAKKEALNLFEEDERKEQQRKEGKTGGVRRRSAAEEGEMADKLPPISMINVRPPRPQARAEEAAGPGQTTEPAGEETVAGESEAKVTDDRVIHIKPPIIVKRLAELLGLRPFQLIKDLIELEVFTTPDKAIDAEIAAQVCEKHGFTFYKEKREKGGGVHRDEVPIVEPAPVDPKEKPDETLKLRPPIITFMGHVDHGKTSLLDAIRKSRVAGREAGGITQHIGAYSVDVDGTSITFLDTPGHAAFTQMRARGAVVTDVVVLVVAADDGIMPQTLEALNHARAAGVTIMVAINKIDVPGADVTRVKGQLQEHDLSPTDWGGETECVEVSATEGLGIDDLLETMVLQAEVLDLRATHEGPARATVIESRLETGRGPSGTVIVQSGVLKIGMPFICGPHHGKIKSMIDGDGKPVEEAGPAMPVAIVGFSDMPRVGDEVVEMKTEREAKKLSEERIEAQRKEKLTLPERSRLEAFFKGIEPDATKMLNLILKADVAGSVEAIVGALQEIESNKVSVHMIHTGAGPLTESDILLASASDAICIGFNVKVEANAVRVAKREGVQVKLYSIIYELIDQVKEAMLGMLDPEMRETKLGHAKVKQIFKVSRGRVAGCLVTDGRIDRSARARVLRGDQPVYDGAVQTLRRFEDDVQEVKTGLECGIRLGEFNEYQVDDVIECYRLDKIDQTL